MLFLVLGFALGTGVFDKLSDDVPGSESGRRALIVPVTLRSGLDDDAEEAAIDSTVDRIEEMDAPQVHVNGGPLLGKQLGGQAQEDVKKAESISLPVVMVLPSCRPAARHGSRRTPCGHTSRPVRRSRPSPSS
ncbi:hypothetical protein [Streptomyces sp. NPDC020747]|uniref:hypothetical protein n=1 Tax=Streptomyces sp. NPDC020747 TaxID=3365086 RepID=UPI0037BC1DA5